MRQPTKRPFFPKNSPPRPIITDPICHNKLEIPYFDPNNQTRVQLTCVKLHLNHNFTHHHPYLSESNCKFTHLQIPQKIAHRHQEQWKICRFTPRLTTPSPAETQQSAQEPNPRSNHLHWCPKSLRSKAVAEGGLTSTGGSGDWSGTALKAAPTDALPLALTAAPGASTT